MLALVPRKRDISSPAPAQPSENIVVKTLRKLPLTLKMIQKRTEENHLFILYLNHIDWLNPALHIVFHYKTNLSWFWLLSQSRNKTSLESRIYYCAQSCCEVKPGDMLWQHDIAQIWASLSVLSCIKTVSDTVTKCPRSECSEAGSSPAQLLPSHLSFHSSLTRYYAVFRES